MPSIVLHGTLLIGRERFTKLFLDMFDDIFDQNGARNARTPEDSLARNLLYPSQRIICFARVENIA
jgi:hypothetical protein